MKDEIKEILEDVKRHLDYVEATKQASIRDNEMKIMYNHITNLQERIDKTIEYINNLLKTDDIPLVDVILTTIKEVLGGDEE